VLKWLGANPSSQANDLNAKRTDAEGWAGNTSKDTVDNCYTVHDFEKTEDIRRKQLQAWRRDGDA